MPFLHFLLRKIVRGHMLLARIIIIPYSRLKTRSMKNQKIPMMKNNLLEFPAIKLATLIRNREVKCVEVIQTYIERIREVNPLLNAVVEDRFDEALKEAHKIDEELEKGLKTTEEIQNQTPLLGVPITVKESISVKGMQNQGGRVHKTKHVANEDANTVANMKKAGAIVLLVSNTPELCLNWETYNNVTGLTKNPHNLLHTPGGSSGGEAALIASGASLIGLSSDIAGSSRLPAMFTGIFGHKPTPNAVSPAGHVPGSDSPIWGDFFTIAPMTRYACDLPIALECMKDKNGPKITPLLEVSIKEMKFFYMDNDGPSGTLQPLDTDMHNALLEVAKLFNAKKVNIKLMKYALDLSMSSMLGIENVETIFYKDVEGKPKATVGKELLKFLCGQSDSIFPAIAVGLMQNINRTIIPKSQHRHLQKLTQKLRKEFTELLGPNGVFIYPTFPQSAHRHYEIYHKLVDTAYCMIWNTLGFPATNCPIGMDRNKMPIGIQFVTLPGQDHLTLTVAKEVERIYGGWQKPPMQHTKEHLE